MPAQRRRFRDRVALFLFLLSTLTLLSSGFDTSEAVDHYALAQHLLHEGRLSFASDPGGIFAPGIDGRFYASHEIGNVLALVPSVALGNLITTTSLEPLTRGGSLTQLIVVLNGALFVALIGVAFSRYVSLLGFSRSTGTSSTLVLIFATLLLPYSRILFDGVLAAVCVTWAFVMALTYRHTRSPSAAIATALLLGSAVITRMSCILFVPLVVVYLSWCEVQHRRSVASVARLLLRISLVLVPFALWQGYYNYVRTGSAFLPAVSLPQYASNNAFDGNVLVGLWGLLVWPKSIFLFSPALILSLAGLRRFWRARPAECYLVGSAVALFMVVHAGLNNWAGEWGWGPRYTVTITPLLFLPAVWTLDRLGDPKLSRGAASAVLTFITLGGIVQVTALAINWHYRYAYLYQEARLSSARQLPDAFSAALANVARTLGAGYAEDIVRGASPLNALVSNGINLWWITALRSGIPTAPVVVSVLLLATIAVVALTQHIRPSVAQDED